MVKQVALDLNVKGTLQVLEDEGFVFVTIGYDRFLIKVKGDLMFTLPDDKKVAVKVSYVDAHNHPAKVDGEVTWLSSDDSIATVTVDPADSSKASIAAADELGQVQITAHADADLGTGLREIITTLDVEVVAGEAVRGTIQPVGEPTPNT